MSDAYPDRILQRGRVHPLVLDVARHVQRRGWRVSSIYRPGGTHSQGISLDICPMSYVAGGFGPRTALLVWKDIKSAFPQQTWLVNAELDHLHVQMFHVDAIGRNTPQGTIINRISRK